MSAGIGHGERVAVGAVLLAVPLVLLVVANSGEFSELAAFSPMFFPASVLWGWAGVAAASLIIDLFAMRSVSGDVQAPAVPGSWRKIAIVIIAMLVYVLLLTRIGFLLSSVGFTVIALLTLGSRSVITIVGYGVLMPAALFGLFHHALGLPLPTSPFTYLF